ncbi:NADH dehydrogenase [ubiquinone] 1 alpha subcomplex subunit 13 [Nasonia vitripennis]|uniref:NADH dehydrogenase [ubiquinone] 1 alpha subcomplex subunit 13 n=1 Tax=Nasonia vitripennis TaxID=7425 RepID=A0A7M6W8F6_NASVI|nr:NADH dehydrogenase [ubiquinone] 1 alpha subcomplex subunit 13 [Nasonia vitripennis]
MATAAKHGFTQDMPPKGGYGPINWERLKLKTVFNWKLTVALWAGASVIGFTGYFFNYKQVKREELEMRSARNCLLPILMAERDRAFLKQLRINRDEERELMKNVPEWDVGTYFREPIYITMPDKFHSPDYFEFMAHADYIDTCYRVFRRHLM